MRLAVSPWSCPAPRMRTPPRPVNLTASSSWLPVPRLCLVGVSFWEKKATGRLLTKKICDRTATGSRRAWVTTTQGSKSSIQVRTRIMVCYDKVVTKMLFYSSHSPLLKWVEITFYLQLTSRRYCTQIHWYL